MPKGMNKVMLIGYIGQEPNINSGQTSKVANFSVATTKKWKDKATNEFKEKTEWHKIVCFKYLADIAENKLKKGMCVLVEGSLQTRKWQDKTGADRYTTEILANYIDILSGYDKLDNSIDEPNGNQAEDFDDDVPF